MPRFFGSVPLTVALCVVMLLCAVSEGAFISARYRRNMAVGADGEDERVAAVKLHKRQKEVTPDPNPSEPKRKMSRSYHYRYGPEYPTHHRHLKNPHFPLPKNQLLYP